MAEWLYEDGIGEARAARVDGGTILEAQIELAGEAIRPGAVIAATLGARRVEGRSAVTLAGGIDALIDRAPPGLTEGAPLLVEITRTAIPERGRLKPILARAAAAEAVPAPGPALLDRIRATGDPVSIVAPHMPDRLEAAGWSELLDQAADGEIPFPGGRLLMALTPAMTLFDVDGQLAATPLALAGADAVARAIVRHGIGGMIGVDFPTLPDKAARAAVAAVIDAGLPPPVERTAVNGFGFLQIVRRRQRPSIPEHVQSDPVGAAARAMLRKAARAGPGALTLAAHPRVIARIEGEPVWLAALSRVIGAPVTLRGEPARHISAGDVHPIPR